jgi:selenocysteine lyase/cysteine desulfurase
MPARTRAQSVPTTAVEQLDRWRRDTPGCRDRIHLNNAGAALMPQPVLQTLLDHVEREAAIGAYEASDEAEPRVHETYELLGRLVGAAARNIAIVENATVAFNQAISAFDFRPGDRIVTTRCDYPSNQLVYLSLARRAGVETVRADDRPDGGVDPESVRRLAGHPRTRLVALSWVPTNSGLVQDARAVGAVCAELDVPYLIDACQAVGQLPVDVTGLRCDFLGATGRKFLRGPRGSGFLYVSDRMLERGAFPLLLDMRGADWTDPDAFQLADGARRFENWEYAYALVLGLGAAARYALDVGPAGAERARRLAALLRERLATIPGVRGLDRGGERCAIVTVAVAGHDAADLKRQLRQRGINTSSADRMSGVLDMDEKRVSSVLRFSPHYYNTEDELDAAAAALAALIRR